MTWTVLFHDAFDAEFEALVDELQDELLAHAKLLAEFGPNLGRPTVDTLKGSQHANMKELRFSWNGQVWRVAFAFDPQRQAILLVGGDKGGADQRRFYKRLLTMADERYDDHLNTLSQSSRSPNMARKLDDVMAALPKDRQKRVEARAMELATLKDLRQAVQQTQEQMAAALGVRQDTITRLEKRSDMLLSTMRHYVESMGGRLELVAKFPDRPPVVIDHIGAEVTLNKRVSSSRRGRAAA